MGNGALTAQVVRSLQEEFEQKGFDVLHDHRQNEINSPDKLGKLRSWFGPDLKSKTLLADLDIAIVSRNDNKVYALIEIEETTDKPKVILGDVFVILLGEGIAFQGKRDLRVGEWTTLIVVVHDTHESHRDRLAFLAEQINILKSYLTTPNKSIGKIALDSFPDKNEKLADKIMKYVKEAVSQRGKQ